MAVMVMLMAFPFQEQASRTGRSSEWWIAGRGRSWSRCQDRVWASLGKMKLPSDLNLDLTLGKAK